MHTKKNSGSPTIGESTWEGKYWGLNGALYRAKRRYKMRLECDQEQGASIEYASTLYGAFNNARAQLRSLLFPVWALRAAITFFKARSLVKRFLMLYMLEGDVPTSDEYDVAASILSVLPRDRKEACAYISGALDLCLVERRGPSHEALLLVKKGKIIDLIDPTSDESWALINNALLILPRDAEATIRTRVYQIAGEYFCTHGKKSEGLQLLRTGLEIARAEGPKLKGAVIKLEGALHKYNRRGWHFRF